MTQILLVRHAVNDFVKTGKLAGWTPGVHLNDDGRAQAEALGLRLADAPLIVAVVSAPVADHPKIPLWEQQLSAGAVCLNLLHAAQAHGFAAQWLTGWYAYDPQAARWLGLRGGERFAGFLHIGTPKMPPTERERPDLEAITTRWNPEQD